MLVLGKVKPGATIYIPFDSFKGADGSSITASNFAVGDIKIYKDGSTTERASTSGFTLLDTDGIDFDGVTGIHGFSIDLSDNTTADFYAAGSRYLIAVGPITIDGQTVNFWAARFEIGYEGSILDTTLATLASQTSFTLAAGPADNNALVGCVAVIHDAASAVQIAIGVVSAYTGSTKTVTLAADPAIFTMAAKDNISFFPPTNVRAISEDLTAADNCELMFDGTGYAGGTAMLKVDLQKILTTALTETSAGYLAAAFKKFLDVAAPVFTAACVNQGADSNVILSNGTYGNAAIKTAIGTPVALDSGTASLSGMLTKIADDNGGATFDATNDSLNKISSAVQASGPVAMTASGNGTIDTGTLLTGNDWLGQPYGANATATRTQNGGSSGAYWGITTNAGVIQVTIPFDAAATGKLANSVRVIGHYHVHASASGKYVNVRAYNYKMAAYETISTATTRMNGTTTDTDQTYTYALSVDHMSTTGLASIQFVGSDTTATSELRLDYVAVLYQTTGTSTSAIADAVYQRMLPVEVEGVWLDTVNGNDSYDGVSIGTAVKTIGVAYTRAAALNVNRIYFKAGSNATAVQFSQSAAGWRFIGPGVIDINGQSVADAVFEDCYTVSNTGSAVGDDTRFYRCGIGNGAFRHGYWMDCMMKNSTGFTMYAGDEYHFLGCKDATPDAGDPATFTFAAGCVANFRDYQGGIQIKSMASGDVLKLDGRGRLLVVDSCMGGSITIRGDFPPLPTGTGLHNKTQFEAHGGTVTETQRYGTDQNIGVDWSNVLGQTATVALTNTSINDVATKTGYTAAPTAGSIVTASFGTCVLPETTKTGNLPSKPLASDTAADNSVAFLRVVAAGSSAEAQLPAGDFVVGAAGGLPTLDASGNLLAYLRGLSPNGVDTALAAEGATGRLAANLLTFLNAAAQNLTGASVNQSADLGGATAIDGKSVIEALRIVAAVVAGKVSGAGTGEETFKGLDGATPRATVTADASGNRTAVTY